MARGTRRFSPWVESAATDTAKLELLEGFLNRSEIVDCTEYALRWLSECAGVTQSMCLARREGDTTLTAIGSYGFGPGAFTTLTISLEDWRNPLVQILANRRHSFFPVVTASGQERRRRPSTPFEHNAFHVLPLRTSTPTRPSGCCCGEARAASRQKSSGSERRSRCGSRNCCAVSRSPRATASRSTNDRCFARSSTPSPIRFCSPILKAACS